MGKFVKQWDLAFDDSAEVRVGPERNYTHVYDVILDTVYRDAWYILTYPKCPKLGSPHQFDGAAYVVSVFPERVKDTEQWKVTVKWSTQIDDPKHDANPLNRPAVIDIDSTIESVTTFFDAKGELLLNTAGDLIPGQRSLPFLTVTIKKNLARYPDWMWYYNGTVNENGITIRKHKFPPRTLRVEHIGSPDLTFENGTYYYPFTYTMKSDPRTYDEVRINQGFHELVPDGYTVNKSGTAEKDFKKKRITIGTPPEYPSEKQYLDENGRYLPNPKPKDIVVLKRRIEIEKNFSKLILK
ncbi:hypothetical protein [Gimesia fumaroli]|uniref:Uncharacterized protein n=1 Tax=Gimesia fumaroli TaxID=2527976 RepID=A0A518IKV3_9PLAN|nr:hypothetical protein [Gimesia fumaroli]QDV53695.1 hypothetical protein Enr17x_57760 [Gimesia fumaroli]